MSSGEQWAGLDWAFAEIVTSSLVTAIRPLFLSGVFYIVFVRLQSSGFVNPFTALRNSSYPLPGDHFVRGVRVLFQ